MANAKQSPTLLVLAAGMGSRFGGLKQIEGVGPSGETILDYSIHDAMRAGFDRVVFVIRRDIEVTFREAVGSRFEGRIDVDYVFQELDALPEGYAVPEGREKPWGTGHAVLVAKDAVHAPFAIINADDYYGAQSFEILGQFLSDPANTAVGPSRQSGAMVGFRLDQTLSAHGTVSRGVCAIGADGMLQGIEEHTGIAKKGDAAEGLDEQGATKPIDLSTIVSMNMWGLGPDIFKCFENDFSAFLDSEHDPLKGEFYLPSVINRLLETNEGQFRVLETPDQWIGVTHREDTAAVRERFAHFVKSRLYSSRTRSGTF
jgi:hypothetical protein